MVRLLGHNPLATSRSEAADMYARIDCLNEKVRDWTSEVNERAV